MKKQVLLLESDNTKSLRFKNSNLILTDENGRIIMQHSCHRIFAVFIHGEFSITSVLIRNAKKYGITMVFMGYNLRPYFSITSGNIGNFLLRKKQYSYKNNLELAKFIIKNKTGNQRYLMNSLRYKTKQEKKNIKKMDSLIGEIQYAKDTKELLGIEGNASKIFFKTYFKNLDFRFRQPRARSDIFNLLLDIGYYYLFNFIEANVVIYGFDIYCGFYHRFFFQRKSLVCDLIEPFRCIIDRRIRKSYNLKQINKEDFGLKNGQYFVKREHNIKYSKIFLKEILMFKEEIFLFIQSYYRNFMKDRPAEEFKKFLLEEKK